MATLIQFPFSEIQDQFPIDIRNIKISLYQIVNFIKNRNIKNNREENIPSIAEFRQVVWTLISAIYEGG